MKLEITTSSKAVQVASVILGRGIENADIKKTLSLTDTDLKNAKAFRKALLKSFTNKRFKNATV